MGIGTYTEAYHRNLDVATAATLDTWLLAGACCSLSLSLSLSLDIYARYLA